LKKRFGAKDFFKKFYSLLLIGRKKVNLDIKQNGNDNGNNSGKIRKLFTYSR